MRTISYKVSYEKMISRLPAMFAYLETDEQGTCEIVKATKGKQGDYGMIIANINYDKGDFIYECKDGTQLKISNGEKTYRTLIETYYKAIRDKEWERNEDGTYVEPFLAFMEKGIGLKYVGLSEEDSGNEECGVPILDKYPLAPDYIYLGEAKTLYNKMVQLKKQLIFWEEHTKTCAEDRKLYQRAKKEFEMRNGDKLINKLGELIKEAEDVATEYLGYASNTNLTLDFNVNLANTIKDLGLVTPYIQEWVAGKRYYEEDVVYHIDGNGYGMTWYCKPNAEAKKDEFGRPYTEGFYEENTELIFFDDGSTITIGEEDIETPTNWLPQSLNWVKRNERFICTVCGRVYEETDPGVCKCGNTEFSHHKYVDEQKGTKVIEGTCNSHLTSLRRFTTYLNRNDEVETPDNYEDWLWYYRKGMVMNREEKYDEMGNLAVMYCKEKGYANGVEAIVGGDNPTNIEFDEDNKTVVNLASWGDVITDIKAENDREDGGTITFTYWLGVHLKAKIDDRSEGDKKTYVANSPCVGIFDKNYKIQFSRGDIITQEEYDKIENASECCSEMKWYSQDDDGNYKYYFKDFEADTTSPYGVNHGVKYTEKYIYYKGNTSYEVIKRFINGPKYRIGDTVYGYIVVSRYKTAEYLKDYHGDFDEIKEEGEIKYIPIEYEVIKPFINGEYYEEGDIIPYSVYQNLYVLEYDKNETITSEMFDQLSKENKPLCDGTTVSEKFTDDNKKKCKPVEETIWSLVEKGKFDDYINGKFDREYKPDDMTEEDTDAPYYYRLYEKMKFYTGNNIYVYNIRIGNRINKVPFLRTDFTTTVDITHTDIEERPLIRYDYYNGVSFQPSVNDDVYVERGITQAFEKYIKFSEIKTFEDLENYANGGFFVISKEDIDLG